MAQIHREAFVLERPWTAEEFDHLAAQPSSKILSVADCFVFGRLTLEELEILTIACSPSEQRQGYAFMLMMELLSITKKEGGHSVFLEVAADNIAARALYRRLGFDQAGCRKNYYKRRNGLSCDAFLLKKSLI
tara:strand:- start:70 stop:468 length:399 start_codon:yes stop_codon:yes gene_type:complete